LRSRLLELSQTLKSPRDTPDAAVRDEAGVAQAESTEQTGSAEADDDTAPTDAVVAVPTKRLLLSQLLTPEVFFVPIALAGVVGFFVWEPDLSFYGIAGMVTATVGTLLQPVRRAMSNYGFTLRDADDRLHIRRGLTERRHQQVPRNRVTAVTIVRPLLWRRMGWMRATASNAAYAGQGVSEAFTGGTILPVGTLEEARAVTTRALSGVDVCDVPVDPTPRRARWCAPIAQPVLGAKLTDDVFLIRSGRVTRALTAVPYARIQSVRVVQGRVQRMLRLATVHADIAGGLTVRTYAEHRDFDEARQMAEELHARARRAARAESEPAA
ncbi:MAG: PH domain-containing protein, partial [Stackebrandtia sp.]